jgi:galactitol-specific phosphotransferase system IIC component
MNYFLYLIGGAAILICILLVFTLFQRAEVAVSPITLPAIVASLIIGIVMCALGRIIGLLKTIVRNTARDQVVSQF